MTCRYFLSFISFFSQSQPVTGRLLLMAAAATTFCTREQCVPEMRSDCTEEQCEAFQQQDTVVAVALQKKMMDRLGNDTRIRRTPAGVPCTPFTCQPALRHWGCSEELCADVNMTGGKEHSEMPVLKSYNESSEREDFDIITLNVEDEDAEWLVGRSLQSPTMTLECQGRCQFPTSMSSLTNCPVQVCREHLSRFVSMTRK
jgi:hypothetical protein